MKLLACLHCSDTFSLHKELRTCKCGKVSGKYVDNLNAEVSMPDRKSGVVLGFANSSINRAICEQIVYGDSEEKMYYAGKAVAKGREFSAFIIPESVDSVKITYENTE